MKQNETIIFHVDLDCFYASVVLLDHPEYKGLPIIVGADPKKGRGRGVVSTCSYEAREFGVHSGMPISQAYDRCSYGIYTRPNFKRIKEISNQVMDILKSFSTIFQQTSIDEAYLDFSGISNDFIQAKEIAEKIKNKVKKEIGVTCSIGIAFSKTLAKIGSDLNKPDGIAVITLKNYKKKLFSLKITRIPGIGKKTKVFYQKKGFFKIGDFYKIPKHKMNALFGDRSGTWIWEVIHGKDGRKVYDSNHRSKRKSVSKERTFHEDVEDHQVLIEKISELNKKIHKRYIKKKWFYRTVSIKIRFEGFETYTRAKSLHSGIFNEKKALKIATGLLEEFREDKRKVRLIGLKFSNFSKKIPDKQKTLLSYY